MDLAEEKDFRRRELLGKYTVKMLYGWDNRKFEGKYLRKLERNWWNWKVKDKIIWEDELTSFSRRRNLEGGVISEL